MDVTAAEAAEVAYVVEVRLPEATSGMAEKGGGTLQNFKRICHESPALARGSRPNYNTACTCLSLHLIFYYLFNIEIVVISKELLPRTRMTDAGGNFALQVAAKPLQTATWLLLTAYRNLPTPYPRVPLPLTYHLATIQNVKERQTTDDDRQTDDTSYHKLDR